MLQHALCFAHAQLIPILFLCIAATSTTIVAWVTIPVDYMTDYTTTTSPGYAPTELCQTTTVTNIIPGTTSILNTYSLLYFEAPNNYPFKMVPNQLS
jgi:hypothetical protein